MKNKHLIKIFLFGIIALILSSYSSFAKEYTFSHDEAIYFLSFLYDVNTNKLAEKDFSDNVVYKLLRGQLTNSDEEKDIAKIALLSTAYSCINQSLDAYERSVDVSRAHLLDYLEKHANTDISGTIATGIMRKVFAAACECVLHEMCGWRSDVEEIREDIELVLDTLGELKDLNKKAMGYAEKVQAYVAGAINVTSTNKLNMYKYFNEYVNAYTYIGENADLYMSAYDLELSGTILAYDPILNWHSENNIETLKRWAKYLSDIEISMSASQTANFYLKLDFNYDGAEAAVLNTAQNTIDYFQENGYAPKRDGYTFDGWYLDKMFYTKATEDDIGSGQIWYAKWKKNPEIRYTYTITFDSNCDYIDNYSYVYDTRIGNWVDDYKPKNRPGYVFIGWYWEPECENSVTDVTINKDLTFYAKWVSLYKYTIADSTITITGINAYEVKNGETVTDITLPDSIDGYPVKKIAEWAFSGSNKLITSISIPDTVTDIGNYAFRYCTSLKSVKIPGSVAVINCETFYNCTELQNVTLSEGLTKIDTRAFAGCVKLTDLKLPNTLQVTGTDAFSSCTSLKKLIIPKNLTKLGGFGDCDSLTSITIPSNVKICDGIYGCKNLTEIIIENGVEEIGGFSGCTALTSITIPSSVKKIDNGFSGCTLLSKVIIEYGVEEIGNYAFQDCPALNEIEFPGSIKKLGLNLFAIANHGGAPGFEDYSYNKTLKKIVLKEGISEIGTQSFMGCQALDEVVFPDTLKVIKASAFSGCIALKNIVLPNSVTKIANQAFSYCTGLESIVLPDTIDAINAHTFMWCTSLKEINIPANVTYIGIYAFNHCDSLCEVYIPKNIVSIEDRAFTECKSIISFCADKLNENFYTENGVLYSRADNRLVCYPAALQNKSFFVPNGIEIIDNFTFYKCSYLENITLPNTLKQIGTFTFAYCDKITDITIPNSVTEIGDCAFYYCTGLKSITLPNKLEKLSGGVLEMCTSLAEIEIPESVTEIGYSAFMRCTSLKSITIPQSVKTFGNNVFYNCNAITDVYYTGTAEQWKNLNISAVSTAKIHYNATTLNEIDLQKNGNILNIGIKVRNIPENASLYVAICDKYGKIIELLKPEILNEYATMTVSPKTPYKIQAFIWEDISYIPIVKNKEINITNY